MDTITQREIDENRTQWLGALRSGEYQQGTGALRRTVRPTISLDELSPNFQDQEFCCLGVACDVLRDRGVSRWRHDNASDTWAFGRTSGVPPYWVQEAFGLSHEAIREIITFNDIDKWSYAAIADHLEDAWWGHLAFEVDEPDEEWSD